jgi:thiamine biosynthesis lipoprotein
MNLKKTVTRRQFLKIIAASSAIGLAWKLGIQNLSPDLVISETRLLMGTIINLVIISENRESASEAIKACFNSMSELESVLSRFQPESQLSKLNRSGVLEKAHPALLGLVKQSLELSQLSGGAFDITVKPLLDLYQSNPGVLPATRQIDQALKLVGYQKMVLGEQGIAFDQPGMSITLDGIAKGFILDKGIDALKSFGYENALVEAGGDLMGFGEKAPKTPWKIGLQAPRGKIGDLIASFDIQDRALATSGDYMQTFTPDFSSHHIIDPRSGRSSPELASVSITANTVTLADALATTVMVMGKSGLELIEQLDGCEAFALTKGLSELKTSGFQVN